MNRQNRLSMYRRPAFPVNRTREINDPPTIDRRRVSAESLSPSPINRRRVHDSLSPQPREDSPPKEDPPPRKDKGKKPPPNSKKDPPPPPKRGFLMQLLVTLLLYHVQTYEYWVNPKTKRGYKKCLSVIFAGALGFVWFYILYQWYTQQYVGYLCIVSSEASTIAWTQQLLRQHHTGHVLYFRPLSHASDELDFPERHYLSNGCTLHVIERVSQFSIRDHPLKNAGSVYVRYWYYQPNTQYIFVNGSCWNYLHNDKTIEECRKMKPLEKDKQFCELSGPAEKWAAAKDKIVYPILPRSIQIKHVEEQFIDNISGKNIVKSNDMFYRDMFDHFHAKTEEAKAVIWGKWLWKIMQWNYPRCDWAFLFTCITVGIMFTIWDVLGFVLCNFYEVMFFMISLTLPVGVGILCVYFNVFQSVLLLGVLLVAGYYLRQFWFH